MEILPRPGRRGRPAEKSVENREKKAKRGWLRRRRPKPVQSEDDTLVTRLPQGSIGRKLSPLTLRILALNVLTIGTFFGGLMYLGAYEKSLIVQEIEALGTQARIFAGALGESAVTPDAQETQTLNLEVARLVMRRLVAPTKVRARLFGANGNLVADSRVLSSPGGVVHIEDLPPPANPTWFEKTLGDLARLFARMFRSDGSNQPLYKEGPKQTASDYGEVRAALAGNTMGLVRRMATGHFVLIHAVPVQRTKKVVGALMLSKSSREIETSVRRVRLDILRIFAVVMLITGLLSIYLARTIARPINILAAAAERMRRGHGHGRQTEMPDFTARNDEIGDLSAAFRDLTTELSQRLDAIEAFAADVAHEIKNPLSSLRSAVETAARVKDPERQRQLMNVILEDVQRLDRLITDISRASRLDTEMSRVATDPVDIRRMLQGLVDVQRATAEPGRPKLSLKLPPENVHLIANVVEDRLVQVLQNLLANADSFSPPDGVITVSADDDGGFLRVTVDDQGPGIPEGKQADIFRRFYTERPAGEKFGTHSGLGLSISMQIISAFGGAIHAENLKDENGNVSGARFVIRLPKA